jgi:hypothetical protein
MRVPRALTLPPTLHPQHAALLREHRFETAGLAKAVLRTDEYDGVRTLYAITNPEQTEVVYVGDAEVGRDLRARLKAHLDSRGKAGHVEPDSLVFVHVMVTEYMVLSRFQEDTGSMPVLNKRKVPKYTHARQYTRVNGHAAAEALDGPGRGRRRRARGRTTSPRSPEAPQEGPQEGEAQGLASAHRHPAGLAWAVEDRAMLLARGGQRRSWDRPCAQREEGQSSESTRRRLFGYCRRTMCLQRVAKQSLRALRGRHERVAYHVLCLYPRLHVRPSPSSQAPTRDVFSPQCDRRAET